MKNISLALNAVLLVAVIVLYVLFFSQKKGSSVGDTNNGIESENGPAKGIAYVNIDSVFANYEMYKDVAGEFEEKMKTSEAKLQSQQSTFQKKVEDFQYNVQRGLITRAEAEKQQGSLAQEEQQLLALQNQLQGQLAEEQQVSQRKVLNSITEYLKTMEGSEKYKFILGNTFGGNIMYADEKLDITKEVVEGLNLNYKKTSAK
jgi:outer membrane protein